MFNKFNRNNKTDDNALDSDSSDDNNALVKKIDITDFILKMLKVDKKIKCYPIMNEWIDMGTPEDYLKLKNKF